MKWLQNFFQYKESLKIDTSYSKIDLMESLNIWQDVLLNSINAEQVDIYSTLNLDKSTSIIDIDILFDSTEFINSFESML